QGNPSLCHVHVDCSRPGQRQVKSINGAAAEDIETGRVFWPTTSESGDLMSATGKPNTIDLRGFDGTGQPVYSLCLSVAEFPKVKHLWEDAEHLRSHRIARLMGVLYDERGEMEQEYERHYDPGGCYLGGTIKYADGRMLHANTGGLEPSTIPHGQ